MMYPFSHKPNAHPKSMKYAQHVILAMQTRLFVTLTRYCKGVTEAKTLSTVRSNTCPALTSIKTAKEFNAGSVRFCCCEMAQPQYTINGQTTKPTRRSAIAIDTMIWLEGEDLSFFRGSIQTDKMTNRFPKMIIGHMTIEGIAIVIDMAFEFPTLCHALAKSSLVILPVIAAILRRKASLSVLFKISECFFLRIPRLLVGWDVWFRDKSPTSLGIDFGPWATSLDVIRSQNKGSSFNNPIK